MRRTTLADSLQGAVDVAPLLGDGAIVRRHTIVEGKGDQLWGSGRGAIDGCHCRMPL